MERWMLRLQRGADALEHQVEGGQLADLVVADLHGHLLEDAQHGALAHRAVLALEGVVLRQVLDGRLEQRELVGDERVAVDEVVAVPEVAVGLGAVGEVEQGLEVVRLPRGRCPTAGARRASFLASRRFWITSATSALVSFMRLAKRAWILEKSLPCCLLISPTTVFMSSWAVTMTQARPRHLVARLSAIVCRLVISLTLSAMYWPTSSTKKFSRKSGACWSR